MIVHGRNNGVYRASDREHINGDGAIQYLVRVARSTITVSTTVFIVANHNLCSCDGYTMLTVKPPTPSTAVALGTSGASGFETLMTLYQHVS